MKAIFEKTVDILVKAYLNNTLQHGNCYACAVGNIIASGLGCEVVKNRIGSDKISWSNDMPYPGLDKDRITGWGAAFVTEFNSSGKLKQTINETALQAHVVSQQIVASGYTWQELAKIEFAFESVRGEDFTKDQLMFNGLMEVVDVLAEIHGIDLKIKEQAKQLFVKS